MKSQMLCQMHKVVLPLLNPISTKLLFLFWEASCHCPLLNDRSAGAEEFGSVAVSHFIVMVIDIVLVITAVIIFCRKHC